MPDIVSKKRIGLLTVHFSNQFHILESQSANNALRFSPLLDEVNE